ncbi:MAG TPA: DUF996 domain-containing protein [Conexivisphaerales archaeon]|nr:DUF996 domain-containing protein [Conexivisphaerales archaeon]
MNWNGLAPYIGAIAGALIILFDLTVVAAVLMRRSFGTLAQKSGINMFDTSGLVLLIGAVLTIIIVGFVLIWVALMIR